MTDQELIDLVYNNLGETVDTVLEACEAFYMNGFCSEEGGMVDASTGHFYRIERWLVLTNDQGFSELIVFNDQKEAHNAFNNLDKEYGEWLEENGDA